MPQDVLVRDIEAERHDVQVRQRRADRTQTPDALGHLAPVEERAQAKGGDGVGEDRGHAP